MKNSLPNKKYNKFHLTKKDNQQTVQVKKASKINPKNNKRYKIPIYLTEFLQDQSKYKNHHLKKLRVL